MTLKHVTASFERCLDRTNSGAVVECRCHSMMRDTGTLVRNMPVRRMAKYFREKSSVWNAWIWELISGGRRGWSLLANDISWIPTGEKKGGRNEVLTLC